MKVSHTIPFSEKYKKSPKEFRGNMMMIDIVGELSGKLTPYGELKTFSGKITDGSAIQFLQIPEKVSIKIHEDHKMEALVIEYIVFNNDPTLAEVIESCCKAQS
jgi:hypothetical protein